MEVNDRRLGPVVSKAELNFLRKQHQQQQRDVGGHCAFEWEEAAEAWTSLLRGMERVDVALCFDTGTAEEGWASNIEARAFFRRLPQGDPLAILEVAVSVSRPFLSQHFRWFADEGRKLVRTVPISRSSPLSEVAIIPPEASNIYALSAFFPAGCPMSGTFWCFSIPIRTIPNSSRSIAFLSIRLGGSMRVPSKANKFESSSADSAPAGG
uniref:Uncharacterized protein n=1 Tax=Globodera pallida TaxID=36090 RepID=A0A183BIH0_GLOPA